jgi:hypothetical protein
VRIEVVGHSLELAARQLPRVDGQRPHDRPIAAPVVGDDVADELLEHRRVGAHWSGLTYADIGI